MAIETLSHEDAHPLAGQTVHLNVAGDHPLVKELSGKEYRIEDWWDRLTGGSWMHADGNPAALKYAFRAGMTGLPTDDEVVYGKVGAFGHLVHVSELGEPVVPDTEVES